MANNKKNSNTQKKPDKMTDKQANLLDSIKPGKRSISKSRREGNSTKDPYSYENVKQYIDQGNAADIFSELDMYGPGLTYQNDQGNTLLHLAISKGDKNIVEALLKDREINVKLTNKTGKTPLHLAAFKGKIDVLNDLLEKGADINKVDVNGKTPLHLAVSAGKTGIVKSLLEKGADINIKDKKGQSPLDIARTKKQTEIIELLQPTKSLEPEVDTKKEEKQPETLTQKLNNDILSLKTSKNNAHLTECFKKLQANLDQPKCQGADK